MKLNSLRLVLLKKAAHDPQLHNFIESSEYDYIMDRVVESLEKMATARSASSMGGGANGAVRDFARKITNTDLHMVRDSLAHHISAHKAELKAGNRTAADMHLNKIIPLMHLIAKAAPHSEGKIDISYVKPQPWEANYTTLDRGSNNKYINDQQGLKRRATPNSNRSLNIRSVPDYRYLEMKPHGGHDYANNKISQFKDQGYPFEEIQVGRREDIDSERAYLPIREMEATGVFRPHPFDSHPVHSVHDLKQEDFATKIQSYVERLRNWHDHSAHDEWENSLTSSPELESQLYERGANKPEHHFSNIPLLDQPDHIKAFSSEQPSKENESIGSGKLDESQIQNLPESLREKFRKLLGSQVTEQAKPIEKQPASQPSQLNDEMISRLPPELRAKFIDRQKQQAQPVEIAQQAPAQKDTNDEDPFTATPEDIENILRRKG